MHVFNKSPCIPLVLLFTLGISGCNGGGGGGSSTSAQALVYTGNTNPTVITTDNSKTLAANVIGSSGTGLIVAAGIEIQQQPVQSPDLVQLGPRLSNNLRKALNHVASSSGQGVELITGARVDVDETQSCDLSGTIHTTGSLDDVSGIGTLNITFNSCNDYDGWLNGQATYRIDAYDAYYDFFTDTTIGFTLLQVKHTNYDVSISGSLRSLVAIPSNREQISENFVTRDDTNGKFAKVDNLAVIVNYDSVLYPSSYYVNIMGGRIFDSVEGYVDVATTTPWYFATLMQDFPTSGGALVLTGANNAHISVTPASSTLVNLELDLDANGAYELASTMPWTFLAGTPPTTNTAPTANAGTNRKISQSTIVTLDGSGSSDPDYDFLTYQWALVQKPNGSLAQLSSAATVQPTFTPDIEGIYVINLLVSDGKLSSGASTVTITFINTAPIANAGPNQTVPKFTMVTLNGSGSSDPDNDFLTYQWTVVQKPNGSLAQLSGPTSVYPTFTPDLAGSYLINLVVKDGKLSSAASTVTITAYNIVPAAVAGPTQYVFVGPQVTLDGSNSSDGNGDPLTYSWSFILKPQSSAATLSNPNTASPFFTPDVTGAYRLSLTVNDGTANSQTSTVTVYVATAPASAAQWRVPADFPTIQAAIDVASPGNIISVAPGTYVGNLRFNGKAVTLQSTAGPSRTIIEGSNDTAVDIGPDGAIIGFTIRKGVASFGAGMAINGTGTLIKQNIFESNAQGGGGYGAAIGGNSASPTIDSNIFYNNTCDNQFLSGVISFVNSSSPVIINNVIENNPCRAINMTLPEGNTPQVTNNTIVSNQGGIHVDCRVSTAQHIYRNNLIVGNDIGLEIIFGTETDNPTWQNNLVFGNGVNYSGTTDKTNVSGNISSDPMFVDQTGDFYFLMAGSPAIDHGTNTGAPTFDFIGRSRPIDGNGDGSAVTDIGAFEY